MTSAILNPAAGPLSLAPANSTSDPKVFLRAYFEWLSVATDQEAQQLDAVVMEHSPHVRPLVQVFTDILSSRTHALRLPPTLLATFVSHGWKPAINPSQGTSR